MIHQQLGRAEGPSVTWKVIVAFLLPTVVFAAGLALFGSLLNDVLPQRYQTPLAGVLALAVTFGVMWVVSLIFMRLHRNS